MITCILQVISDLWRMHGIQPCFILIREDKRLSFCWGNWLTEPCLHLFEGDKAVCQFFTDVIRAMGTGVNCMRYDTRPYRAAFIQRFNSICQAAGTHDLLRWNAKAKIFEPAIRELLGFLWMLQKVRLVSQA